MSEVTFSRHRVFRETESVTFFDISVKKSNATDLVIHEGPAISPPDDAVGAKTFYVHHHQTDYNRVVSGSRVFELVNPKWAHPYHIVNLTKSKGAVIIPPGTYHRSVSGDDGSILINQAVRDDKFDVNTEFIPVSAAENKELYKILTSETPVIHS